MALDSGMKQGEIVALRWSDVQWPPKGEGSGETDHDQRRQELQPRPAEMPKNRKARQIKVAGVAGLLREWHMACGRPGPDALVFEKDSGGYVDGCYLLRRILGPAMTWAKVPKLGPVGEPDQGSRDWHSLRHTWAVRALSQGLPLYAVSQHLGHSGQQ